MNYNLPLLQNLGGSSRVAVMHKPAISFLYIVKTLLAFVFIFVLGAIFALALEYLPVVISSLNSFM